MTEKSNLEIDRGLLIRNVESKGREDALIWDQFASKGHQLGNPVYIENWGIFFLMKHCSCTFRELPSNFRLLFFLSVNHCLHLVLVNFCLKPCKE